MMDWYALRFRCRLWILQSWPFRLLAWVLSWCVPEEKGFGPSRTCGHPGCMLPGQCDGDWHIPADSPLQAIFDPKYDEVFSIENSLRLFNEADALLTPADRWWIAEMRELHVQRAELKRAERYMVGVLWKVGAIFVIAGLAGTWLWLRLKRGH